MSVTLHWRESDPTVCEITVEEDLTDDSELRRLHKALAAAIEEKAQVFVDLRELSELPAEAVGVLAEAATRLRWAGGDLQVQVSPAVGALLSRARLSSALGIDQGQED